MMIAVKEMRESDAAACEQLIENVTQLEKKALYLMNASSACTDFFYLTLSCYCEVTCISKVHNIQKSEQKAQFGANPTQFFCLLFFTRTN